MPTTEASRLALVTSHGGDFYGEDRHPARVLLSVAEYAYLLHHDERELVVQLLREAAGSPAGTTRSIPTAQVATLAPPLRRLARNRMKPADARTAALLADAAERAAADGDAWTWRAEDGDAA
ncbi:hypothetical protein ACH4E8_34360 [Streptomyces sp. NPDC017979]|uniref:DUF7739 domain-containing protein n=1 Tax=Streptomyces sp. NPDC017979 TaxID=3365024 RepID=UPI00379B02D6